MRRARRFHAADRSGGTRVAAVAPRLEGHELVAHVFVVADGPDSVDAYAGVVALWERACAAFGIDRPIGSEADVPPADLPEADGVMAVRAGFTGGKYFAVLRRTHDVLCLTVLQAPSPGSGSRWDTLDARWSAVLAPPIPKVIGSVRILQARQVETTSLDADALGPVVRWENSVAGDWWREGVVRPQPPLGPFAVWEATEPGNGQVARDGRVDRRIVVVAEHHRDAELSAWTWTRGGEGEPTPFTRYLLHAAKLRYELRVWGGSRVRRELRKATDEAIAPLLRLADDVVADTRRAPDVEALLDASVRLVALQARELGLVDRSSRLRELRIAAAIAAANMAAHADGDQDHGLFADDKAVAGWLDRQLDRELTFLDAAAERARSVTALADQLVQRGLAGRQQRFNLGLTAVISAVLMVLAAIQSFDYKIPIPEEAQPSVVPAVIAVLGALAFFLSMVVFRTAAPRRRASAVGVCLSAGLLVAALVWTMQVVVVASTGRVPVAGVIAAWAVVGGVVGLGAAALAVRRR